MKNPNTINTDRSDTIEILTKKELARRLRTTTRSIDNYTNQGIIKRLKLGALSRYDWQDVVTSIKNQQTNG